MAGRIAYYGNIVTSGLVLNLDAAKRDSYPGSGTTWRDISGNGNSCNLNGVDYSSLDGGYFRWDNDLDRISINGSLFPALTNYTNATVCFWLKSTDTRYVVFGTSSPYLGAVHVGGNGNGSWYHNSVGSPTSYRNGNISSGPVFSDTWNYYTFTNCNFAASTGWNSTGLNILYYAGGWEFNPGQLSMFQIYNRALSTQEILQNYNATKTRYGL